MEGKEMLSRVRGLRLKLIGAFLLVGLLPLLGALWMATETVSDMMEHGMASKLNHAVAQAERYVEREGSRLAMVAYMGLHDDFLRNRDAGVSRREALRIRKTRRVDFVCLCDGASLRGDPDIGLPHKGQALPRDFGIVEVVYRGEKIPALVGVCREGRWVGVAGKLISVSFLEDLEEITGVEVDIYLKTGKEWGLPPHLSRAQKEALRKWLARVESKGVPLYNEDMELGTERYKGILVPLKDWRGKFLGMFLFSLSHGQSFESMLLGNKYFALIMGLGILLSVFLGWWMAGRISEPIQRFAASADSIARGDYSLEVPLTWRRDEIGHLARSFERMRQGLKEAQRREKLASLGELSAGLAHEIRNPLGIIKNAAEGLLGRERSKEEQAQLLDIIVQETRRLNRLVTDFLDFARPRPPEKVPVSLERLVEEVVFSLEGEARERGISLDEDVEEILLPLDRHQIRQVLLNLLLNALEATPSGGQVRVVLTREGEWAVLRVEDTGRGIPAEHLDRIFDPFFTTKERGTGLGLALVYRMVEAHGGTIKVKSNGEGTVFEVKLPL